MKFIKTWIVLIFIAAFGSIKISAQTTNPPTNDDLQKRVAQMEAEMKQMREELAKLKQSLPANQPNAQNPANAIDSTSVAKAETKIETKTDAKTEIKSETKSNQNAPADKQTKQTGVDIGSARLTPYGTIYFNAFGNSGGTNNADVPLFATPTSNGNVGGSVRQTHLGVRVEGAKVSKANLKAVLEADFFGGFPSVGIGENFGAVRLRLASARLDWEKASVTVGQDWMVFAPVNPTSLAAAAAIPQMAAAGNNWARYPRDEDLITLTRRDFRTRNFAYAFDSIYKFTAQFQIGAEFRRFQTDYIFSGRRNANHTNLSAAYSF